MPDASCRKEDIIAAFEDLCRRLDERARSLWGAYHEATAAMGTREYESHEHECWTVLEAGLSGIAAERRMLDRGYEERLTLFDETGAVA